MADEEEVAIRIRVEDQQLQNSIQDVDQKAKTSQQRIKKVLDDAKNLERLENRLEYRMRRIGARFLATMGVEELSGALGIQDHFVGRMGESVAEGFMMGGPQGAMFRATITLLHEGLNQIKEIWEQSKRTAEKQKELDEKFLDFLQEQRAHEVDRQEAEEQRMKQLEEELFRKSLDITQNTMKYVIGY